MIIKFTERNVYETIWTGNVDQILSYDTDRLTWLVKDVETGKEREHMTSLDSIYISESPIKYSRVNQKELLKYMLNKGLPRRVIDDRAGLLTTKSFKFFNNNSKAYEELEDLAETYLRYYSKTKDYITIQDCKIEKDTIDACFQIAKRNKIKYAVI